MKHTHGLLLGCTLMTSFAYSTFARAQIELTCRRGNPIVASLSTLFVERDCKEAAKDVGLDASKTPFVLNGEQGANTVSFTVPDMGNPMYTCFQENGQVRVTGPVQEQFAKTCPVPTGGGGGGGGGGGEWECELVPAEEICHNFPASPIVVDLGEVGYDLTSITNGVRFDIDADGAPEQVSWTAGSSDDAFLALDRNGNGTIDSGRELFGDFTLLGNGKTAPHGYIALGELDLEANGGNGNGYVDIGDRGFRTLLLWSDRNHDGRSSPAELRSVIDSGIFAISLKADESDVVDEHGNHLAYVSPAYAWREFRIERIRTTDIFFRFRDLR